MPRGESVQRAPAALLKPVGAEPQFHAVELDTFVDAAADSEQST